MTQNGIAFPRQPLAPLTDATGSGSWPTPTVSDVMGTTEFHPRKESKPETNHATTLAQKVQWVERQTWPTPDTHQGGRTLYNAEYRGRSAYAPNGKKRTISLENAVKRWPTPRANERGDYQYDGGDHSRPRATLSGAVKGCMFPTPTTQDASNKGGSSQYERNYLPMNAIVGGQLNPTWVEWLMGYPLGWTVCEGWETRSSRRSRSGSRSASKKRKG